MATVTDSNPHGPIDPDRLAAFEAAVGGPLPADYRAYLTAHNGGPFTPDELVRPDEDEPFSSLATVFGLHDEAGSLEEARENLDGVLPPELLAVAEDVGGNLICIGLRGEHVGRVYYWDHQASDPDADEPGWEGVTPLAGSFDAFVAALGGRQPGI